MGSEKTEKERVKERLENLGHEEKAAIQKRGVITLVVFGLLLWYGIYFLTSGGETLRFSEMKGAYAASGEDVLIFMGWQEALDRGIVEENTAFWNRGRRSASGVAVVEPEQNWKEYLSNGSVSAQGRSKRKIGTVRVQGYQAAKDSEDPGTREATLNIEGEPITEGVFSNRRSGLWYLNGENLSIERKRERVFGKGASNGSAGRSVLDVIIGRQVGQSWGNYLWGKKETNREWR